MNKLILGEKKIDLTNKGSLMRLTVEELIWIASIKRKEHSFKENLIDYIIKIHGSTDRENA
jgi:hypothetical protein